MTPQRVEKRSVPLNERCLSSKFLGYDVKSASACATTTLVEAAAARPPLAVLSVAWRPLACILTLLDVLDKLFGLSLV